MFSILGMQLFGCKFCDQTTGFCDRKNFDSLLWATITVFQVCTAHLQMLVQSPKLSFHTLFWTIKEKKTSPKTIKENFI